MDILRRVSIFCIHNANNLIIEFASYSRASLFMCALLVVLLLRVSHKFKLFAKPEHPNISIAIRSNADWINFISYLIVLGFSLYAALLILLTEVGYTLSNPSLMLNATTLKDGAILLFNASNNISIPILEGSIAGLILSLYLNLKVIPNFERGEGLHR